jgi:N-acetyl sugar amidotransferase
LLVNPLGYDIFQGIMKAPALRAIAPETENPASSQTICRVCIMDDSDPDIVFYGEEGCSHCMAAKARLAREYMPDARGQAMLASMVEKIKKAGEGKPYDCVMGLSGGVDSSYVALRAKELGLRPLAVHLDNGWNSELAVKNIENIVVKLGIDLHTHVVDWQEIKDLQRAYFSVPLMDIEVITDHAIFAVLYHQAAKHGIKYILSGSNVATESIMPRAWNYDQRDLKNLRAVHKRFGTRPLKTYPTLSPLGFMINVFVRSIKFIPMLNFESYVKAEVIERLKRELDWKPYANKHGESRFTRFFQDYYLPAKFNVDKRKAHYSSMIASGQMTRDEALSSMNQLLYRPEELKADMGFVLKKLDISESEWHEMMQKTAKKHTDFPNNHWLFLPNNGITRVIKRYAKAGLG